MDSEVVDHGKIVNRRDLLVRHAKDITLALAVLQIVYAALAFTERLSPEPFSTYYVVNTFIDSTFWSGVFLMSGISTLVSLYVLSLSRGVAMAISSAVFLVWGVLCILASVTTVQPVAWMIGFGISVTALGVVAYKMCDIWNTLSLEPALTQ